MVCQQTNSQSHQLKNFLRQITTLISGTTIAQALPILAMPLLTRLYSPEEIGIVATLVAIATIIAAISNGRYEMALVLPKSDQDANDLIALCLTINLAITILVGLTCFFFGATLSQQLNLVNSENLLYLIPFLGFSLACFTALNFFFTRHEQYPNIAKSNVAKSSSLVGVQLISGLLGSGTFGLFLGNLVGTFSAIVYQLKILSKKLSTHRPNLKSMYRQGIRYSNFLKYSTPSALLNAVLLNIMPILIGLLYAPATVGLFALAYKAVNIPLTLISGAVSQVFLKTARDELETYGTAKKTFVRTFLILTALSIPIFLMLYLLATDMFRVIFGPEWKEAGEYASLLTPLLITRFIISPLSLLLIVREKQWIELGINSLLVSSVLFCFFIAKNMGLPTDQYLLLYSLATAAIYIFLLFYLTTLMNKKWVVK